MPMASARFPILLLVLSAGLWACDTSSDTLPPDPGAPGRQTLAGIDSDTDGIRDDVQRYIAQTYPDQPTRKALTQVARAMLDGIRLAETQGAALDNLTAMTRGIECTVSVRPTDSHEALSGLQEVVVNTQARFQAYLTLDAQAGGGTFIAADNPASSCI